MEIKGPIRKVIDFVKNGIWDLDTTLFGKNRARAAQYLKVLIMTLSTFRNQKVNYRAVALAYFTTMALIPCVAVVFAVTSGFGIGDKLEELLLLNFSGQEAIIKQILQYANNIISITEQGAFGIISAASFIWLVFWLMIQVEKAFNYIWEVKVSRKFWKRLSAYFAIIILLPFVMIMFLSTSLLFSHGNGLMSAVFDTPYWENISEGMTWLVSYGITVLVLTLMYKFIPGTKVKIFRAFQAAMITAVFFCLFQWIYLETQIFFNRLNGVFGALAAIPFLMMWLNISWFIVLFGVELSYAFQNVETYRPHPKQDVEDEYGELYTD